MPARPRYIHILLRRRAGDHCQACADENAVLLQVMRVLTEERILGAVDHPFLARLYGTIQTDTHLHFLMQVGCLNS